MQLLKVSPKGQITIPKSARDTFSGNQLLFEQKGKTIILQPIRITLEDDGLDSFSNLSVKSFDFWSDATDDVYEEFYSDKK